MASKTQENLTKKNKARELYIKGTSQKDIAELLGVSRTTMSKWVTEGDWDKIRQAGNVTRPELVNKLLLACDKILDRLHEEDDPALYANAADRISKLAKTIKQLDEKTSIVEVIDVFIAFGKWLEYRSQTDSEITVDFLQKLNHYQDLYIAEYSK